MRFKSLTTAKKAWFSYPDDPDEARFEIGLLTPGEEKEVQGATQKLELTGGGQSLSMDHTRASTLRAMRALKSWENVYDDDKGEKVMPCTDKNKLKMLHGVPGFEEWVNDKLGELASEVTKEAEADEKNS